MDMISVKREANEQPRNILLKVAGKSFRCSCGCNIFQSSTRTTSEYLQRLPCDLRSGRCVMALRKDIQTVMETQGARMTYHIANCLRSDFGKVLEGWYSGTLDTSTVRRA